MNIIDHSIGINKCGYFLTIIPIGDEHFDSAVTHKRNILILKDGIKEAKRMFKCPNGFIKLGDELEHDRKSFTEKILGPAKKCDRRGHEQMGKQAVERIKYNYNDMFCKGDYKLGAVAGNHKVEFSIGEEERLAMGKGIIPPLNSSQMLAEKLGFPYLGDGHAIMLLHVRYGRKVCIYKILVLHGEGRGASEQADIMEFKRVRSMYGHIDMIIKAHSHKPMTTHWGRYMTSLCKNQKEMRVKETTIVNIGSLRGAMAVGHADYGEKHEYTPIPTRFPLIALRAYRSSIGDSLKVRAIPITF